MTEQEAAPLTPAPDTAGGRGKDPRVSAGLAVLFLVTYLAGSTLLLQTVTLTSILIIQYGLLLVPSLILAARLGKPVSDVLSLRRPPVRSAAGALLLGPPSSLLASAVFLVQDRFFPVPPQVVDIFKELLDVIQAKPVLGLFAVAVSPGVCEEILFRGLIQHLLVDKVGPRAGVVAASILFGLFHLELHRVLVTACIGLALGAITLRARSIVPAMILHASYNLWLCVPALLGEARTVAIISEPWVLPAFLVLLFAGIALARTGGRP